MDQLLLQTKLHIPNIPREFIDRPTLHGLMDLLLERKLCLISTPAGYGKTSLIVSWAKRRQQPLVWISLDEGDNNFSRFFAYMVAAIQSHVSSFETGLLERLLSPQGMPHELFLTVFVNALDRIEHDYVIVLDDYHLIHEAEIHESVQYVLDNLPPQTHIVIASREELPFSIANLRAGSQMLEILYPDLRFSEGEASEYLNRNFGLDLSEKEIHQLVEFTEGWIVGLRLAALSLAGTEKKDSILAQLGPANRYIAGYLFDEVFHRQPEEIQSFLLQTSALERFTSALCDFVLEIDSSQSLIANVERSNLFIIPLDNQQEWYRYHHKFSELLYDRLTRTDPTLIDPIYRRASQWFEREGLLEYAIDYAISAQDFLRAAQLMDQIGESLFWTGDPDQVLNWLERLPDVVYQDHPNLWLLRLWAHVTLAQFPAVAVELAGPRQDTILSHISDEVVRQKFESSLAVVSALISINLKYDIDEGMKHARLGIEHIDENSASNVMAPLIYGKACMLSGDLEAAKGLLDRSAVEIEKVNSSFMKMIVTHHRAELASLQGDLERTERLLKEAYQLGMTHHLDDASAFFRVCIDIGRLNYEKNKMISARQFVTAGVRGGERALIAYDLIDGYCALFDLAHLDRDLDRCEQVVSSLEFLGSSSGFAPCILDRAGAMRARLDIYKGDLHSVRLWLEKRCSENTAFKFSESYIARTAVQALVVLKEFEQAKALLHNLLPVGENTQYLRDIVHYRAWLAIVLYLEGNLGPALRVLQKAVRISFHQGYIRSLIDVGDPITDLLETMQREVPPEWEASPIAGYPAVLIAARDSLAEPEIPGWEPMFDSIAEPLTDREIAALDLLTKGFSNQDIAEMMVISESTVKFHLKNIYLKLGVHTRAQAAIRAREIHLV